MRKLRNLIRNRRLIFNNEKLIYQQRKEERNTVDKLRPLVKIHRSTVPKVVATIKNDNSDH